MTGKGVINMDQTRASADGYSEDYPLGGSIEPYDIWREKELLSKRSYFVRSIELKTPTRVKGQMS